HIALRLPAGVLTGEQDRPRGAPEPAAQPRIESRIEVGVTAARPLVVLPHDGAGVEQTGRLPQPREPRDDGGRPADGVDLLQLARGAAAGQQAEDRGAALLFGGIPDRAGRLIGTERARPPTVPPEGTLELQQQARRAAVPQCANRTPLLRR